MSNGPCIVYDLRYAADHFPGIGTHAFALLQALLEVPGPQRYRVLWNPAAPCRRFDLSACRSHSRVEWVECDAPALGPSTPAATGAVLRRIGGDALFSPFSLMPDRPGMPVVLTLHDVLPLAPESRTAWWRRLVFSFALRRTALADVVLTSSEFSRAEIARWTKIPLDRVRVVRLGVMPASEAPRRPEGAPDGPFALTVGINKPHKNLGVLAAAWRMLGSAPPLALVCAGPTDERFPDWSVLAAGVRDVHPLGVVSQAELEWLYEHAVMVLHPSCYEGFGLPVLEAGSRGAPVLCADIPALRELAAGVAGFVPADDASAWARAISDLASDPSRAAVMREAGMRLAAAYDYGRAASEVLDVLRVVMRNRN